MRAFLLGLTFSLMLTGTADARGIDCLTAESAIERSICGRAGLRAQDAIVSRDYSDALRSLAPDKRTPLVDAQRRWLAARDAACGKLERSQRIECLREQYTNRYNALRQAFYDPGHSDNAVEGLILGGRKLSGKGGNCGGTDLWEGGRLLIETCARRLDLDVVRRSPEGDAAVINAYTGGYAWMCSNFPTYLLFAIHNGPVQSLRLQPPEPRSYRECPIARSYASYDGIVVEFDALPYQDGARYLWSPEHGLRLEQRWRFVPRPGTTMLTGPFWNQQLVRGLRALLGPEFERIAESIDHLPIHGTTADGRFVVIADCSAGAKSHFCSRQFNVRVIFDQQTKRFFVARSSTDTSTDPPPKLFPEASRWPPATRQALEESRYDIQWRGDKEFPLETDAVGLDYEN